MSEEKKFIEIYDSIATSYSELERIMGGIFEHLQNNPADEMSKNIFLGLGNAAKEILDSQMALVSSTKGISEDLKKFCIEQIERNMDSLSKAISLTRTIGTTTIAR